MIRTLLDRSPESSGNTHNPLHSGQPTCVNTARIEGVGSFAYLMCTVWQGQEGQYCAEFLVVKKTRRMCHLDTWSNLRSPYVSYPKRLEGKPKFLTEWLKSTKAMPKMRGPSGLTMSESGRTFFPREDVDDAVLARFS